MVTLRLTSMISSFDCDVRIQVVRGFQPEAMRTVRKSDLTGSRLKLTPVVRRNGTAFGRVDGLNIWSRHAGRNYNIRRRHPVDPQGVFHDAPIAHKCPPPARLGETDHSPRIVQVQFDRRLDGRGQVDESLHQPDRLGHRENSRVELANQVHGIVDVADVWVALLRCVEAGVHALDVLAVVRDDAVSVPLARTYRCQAQNSRC